MANLIFVRSAGRFAEFAERVNANDPANAVFVIALLAATGIESDAVLRIKDEFAALVSGTTNEATNTGYARKTLAEAVMTVTYDDTNFRVDVDCPDQTWLAVANDGTGAISDLVFGYDPDSTGGAETAILPISLHDFAITPDGSDITAQIAVGGFARAST